MVSNDVGFDLWSARSSETCDRLLTRTVQGVSEQASDPELSSQLLFFSCGSVSFLGERRRSSEVSKNNSSREAFCRGLTIGSPFTVPLLFIFALMDALCCYEACIDSSRSEQALMCSALDNTALQAKSQMRETVDPDALPSAERR